jgi:hypothetical protein
LSFDKKLNPEMPFDQQVMFKAVSQGLDTMVRHQWHRESEENRPNTTATMMRTDIGKIEGWLERPGMVYPEMMRSFVRNVEPLKVIHEVRRRQVKYFSRRARTRADNGWKVSLKPGYRKDKKTKQDIEYLSSFLENGGNEADPNVRRSLGRDTLQQFLYKLLDDSLSFDQVCVELEPMRFGKGMAGMYVVDGATIRIVDRDSKDALKLTDELDPEGEVAYVQLIDRKIVAAFTEKRMAFLVRNPSSSIYARGYGTGESEMVWKAATLLYMFADSNMEMLNDNMIPPGLLYVEGEYNAEAMEQLRMEVQAGRGGGKRLTLPVWVAENNGGGGRGGAKWIPFHTWNDIQNERIGAWFTAIVCAAHGVAPEEIGMKSFSTGVSALAGNDTAERIASARDSGFIPLMEDIQLFLTDIISDIMPERGHMYEFEWVGLRRGDISWERETDKLVCTVDEIRTTKGMAPHDDPLIGASPVNPSMIPLFMASNQLDGSYGSQPAMSGGQAEEPSQGGAE